MGRRRVLSDEERKEKHKKASREYYEKHPEKIKKRTAKYYKKHIEKIKKQTRKYRIENPELYRVASRKWLEKYPEKGKESQRKWLEKNPEYSKNYYKKNPQASTEEMTKYRRSHRECEWSYCKQNKSLWVHHVLPQHKYPEYVDGNYHGRIGNNLICYCPFHHFAYHYTYSTKRNDKKHTNELYLLWFHVEKWANDNKISIEDLEIELAQMYTPKVILA